MPTITGKPKDFDGLSDVEFGQLLVEFYGETARADGADVRLVGHKVYEIADLTGSLTLDAGSYKFTFITRRTDPGAGNRAAFDTQVYAWDLQTDTTWGEIHVDAGGIPPELTDTAAAFLAQMEAIAGLDTVDEAIDARAVKKGQVVLHLKDYGAVGDKVANDATAVQAWLDALKAFPTTDPPLARPVILDGQGLVCKVNSPLDVTALQGGRGWEIRNLSIVAACAGKVALDLTATRFGRLTNVRVWGDQTNQPHTGILLSRTATLTCTHTLMDNVTIDGYFTSSALHLNSAEENNFQHCMFVNRRTPDVNGDAYAVILDGAGYKTLPSGMPQTPNVGRSSFTVNKFDKCTIQKPFGITGPAMFMQDVASVSFESCYLTNGGGSGIVWRLADGFTPYRVYMDFQLETTGIDNFIEFMSDGVTGNHEIRGLHCTFGNMFTDTEVFKIASSVTTLALRSFRAHVYRWASGVTLAGDLFSSPSKVSIYGGDVVVPAATDLNAPSSFARFDATVTTMDGSPVNWTYTPVLTNWTVSNGVMTGEYYKVGRMVHYRIRYTIGSSDTVAGNFVVSLPFPTDGGTSGIPRGMASVFDTSASVRRNRFATHLSTTTIGLYDADHVQVSASVPFAFAAGDVIDIAGTYEAAS